MTVARARSGALVHAGTLYHDGKAYTGLRKIELPDGFAGLIIDSLQAKSTGHKPNAALVSPPSGCRYPNEVVDGEEVLASQQALRINTTGDQLTRFMLCAA